MIMQNQINLQVQKELKIVRRTRMRIRERECLELSLEWASEEESSSSEDAGIYFWVTTSSFQVENREGILLSIAGLLDNIPNRFSIILLNQKLKLNMFRVHNV